MEHLILILWLHREIKWNQKSKWRSKDLLRNKRKNRLRVRVNIKIYLERDTMFLGGHINLSSKAKLKSKLNSTQKGLSLIRQRDLVLSTTMDSSFTRTLRRHIQLSYRQRIIKSTSWIKCLRKKMGMGSGLLDLITWKPLQSIQRVFRMMF